MTELNLIDVLGIDLHFDHEIVALRHDQHDRITGRDHAADRIGRRLKDDAILRGADVGALELILRRDLALDKLADFAVDITQLLSDVAGKVLVHLNDLQLDFGDFSLRFGACATI